MYSEDSLRLPIWNYPLKPTSYIQLPAYHLPLGILPGNSCIPCLRLNVEHIPKSGLPMVFSNTVISNLVFPVARPTTLKSFWFNFYFFSHQTPDLSASHFLLYLQNSSKIQNCSWLNSWLPWSSAAILCQATICSRILVSQNRSPHFLSSWQSWCLKAVNEFLFGNCPSLKVPSSSHTCIFASASTSDQSIWDWKGLVSGW